MQEKTTGTENFGKSLRGGTNDDHQGVNEQANCRNHHDIPQQEDIPGKVSARTIMTSMEERMAEQQQQHNVIMAQRLQLHNVFMAQQLATG